MSELNAYRIKGVTLGDFHDVYLKSEADYVIAEQKAKADKLQSCLKCLVMRDLIKDCPEKKSAIDLMEKLK